MNSHSMWAMPKRVGVIWDECPLQLGSKESRDPPTVSRWLRAKSLHLIMNEHKMSEMRA
jgi:putative transposase